MFTGIIESIGSIRALTPKGGDVRVHVATGKLDLSDVKLGDSIAVNGVCLTAVELPGDGFAADVSRETLDCTAMNDLESGSPVNLKSPDPDHPSRRAPGQRPRRRCRRNRLAQRQCPRRGISHSRAEGTGQVHRP